MRARKTGAVGGRRYGRNRVIRTLHKSAKFARRIKNGVDKTKSRAEETQNPRSNSPVDYAVCKVENAAHKAKDRAARTATRTLRSPRKKARRQFDRAREHFAEVRRLSPTERRRVAEQAQKTADAARNNADRLKTVAQDAREAASKAKGAVNDAKTALKRVSADGRRYIKTAKRGTGAARGELSSVKTSGGADRLKTRRYVDKFKSRRATIKTAPRLTSTPAAPSAQTTQGRAAAQSRAVKLRNGKTINITRYGTAADEATSPKTTGGTSSGTTPSRTSANANTGNPQTSSTKIDALNNIPSKSTAPNYAAPKGNATATRQAQTGNSQTLSHTRGGDIGGAKGGAGRGVKPSNASDTVGRAADGGRFARSATTAKDAAANTERATSAAKSAKAAKSAGRNVKQTTKGTVKTAKKTVKTAEKSAKTAVKTTKQAAKASEHSAKAAVKSAKIAEKSARIAAKTAAQAAKVAGKALVATVKAAIAAIKGLVALIAAGGWVAVLVILIICMAGLLVGSVYGIFFANEQTASGKTLNGVIAEINAEYADSITAIKDANAGAFDLVDTSGAYVNWREVLAVYAVKTAADPANGADVASMDDIKAAILRGVFWDMNNVTYSLATIDLEEDELDADGLPTGATVPVTKTVLRISVTHRTLDEMAALYGFSGEQREMLTELLKPDYYALWNALLYGITSVGDASLVEIAATQIGNVGGELYWRWYGFTSREAWCAIFISWCAEQAGLIQNGVIPRFSTCEDGIAWFKARNQWHSGAATSGAIGAGGYMPNVGELILFDWNGDGVSDHVGIVEGVSGGEVHTIEGNSSDTVTRRVYQLNSMKILGYGAPRY